LPTGDPASYTGDGTVRVTPRALIAGDIGVFTYAARLGATIRALDETFAGGDVGTDLSFGASAGLRVADKKFVIGPEVFGHAVLTGTDVFPRRDPRVEGLMGAHYTMGDFRLGAGASTGLTAGFGTPQVRGVFPAGWVPGVAPADRDHDGIIDAED